MRNIKTALLTTICALAVSGAMAQEPVAPKIIVVSGPLFDPFFSALKLGADAAANNLGIDYQYSAVQDMSNIEADQARLVDQAVASGPDVLIVGNFFPNAISPILKRATEEGIKVIVQDGGYATWQDVGAFTYVGYDPASLGVRSGEIQAEAGAKDVVCINHVPGNPSLEDLCRAYIEAVEDAGGKGRLVTIPASDSQNPQANLQAIRGALESDPDVDGIMTLGATQTVIAAQAAAESGFAPGEVLIGGSGLSTKVLELVRDGEVMFGVDLQAYLDGYYGIVLAYQKAVYDLGPVERSMPVPVSSSG